MKNTFLFGVCLTFVFISYMIPGRFYVSDSVENFFKFFTFPTTILVSIYLCYSNIFFLKRNPNESKMLPILFLIFSVIVFFYSFLITVGLFAFRNFGSL